MQVHKGDSGMERATLDYDTSNSVIEREIERPWFRQFIIILIVINAVVLGVLTYHRSLPNDLVVALEVFDRAVTFVFAVEILLKLFVYRVQFFRSGWNWFDFVVIGVSMLPGGAGFSVLRAMRVLRVLRLLHIIPMMKRITEALMNALPGMGAIFAVLALVTYVAAVMATNMFGDTTDPDVALLFGDLPKSAYSLFQVMTMDGWRFEVVQKVIDDGNPYAWIFFMIFIFIASFAILNLFIALVVEALASEQKAVLVEGLGEIEEDIDEAEGQRSEMVRLMTSMRAEIAELKQMVAARDA